MSRELSDDAWVLKARDAEIERLTGEVQALHEMIGEIDRQHVAEVERLRAALNELWRELSYMDGDKAHRLCVICKDALEPKP